MSTPCGLTSGSCSLPLSGLPGRSMASRVSSPGTSTRNMQRFSSQRRTAKHLSPYAVSTGTRTLLLKIIFALIFYSNSSLLARSGPEALPRFLTLYRQDHHVLLSDDVTEMLGSVLGPAGVEWLEGLVYF